MPPFTSYYNLYWSSDPRTQCVKDLLFPLTTYLQKAALNTTENIKNIKVNECLIFFSWSEFVFQIQTPQKIMNYFFPFNFVRSVEQKGLNTDVNLLVVMLSCYSNGRARWTFVHQFPGWFLSLPTDCALFYGLVDCWETHQSPVGTMLYLSSLRAVWPHCPSSSVHRVAHVWFLNLRCPAY